MCNSMCESVTLLVCVGVGVGRCVRVHELACEHLGIREIQRRPESRTVQSVHKSSGSDSDSSIFKTPTPTPRFLKLRLRLLDF
jgi:hypothetical protein